jgi:hypothetical protein
MHVLTVCHRPGVVRLVAKVRVRRCPASRENHQFSTVAGQSVLAAGLVPDLMPVRQNATAVLLTFVGQSAAQRRAERHRTILYVKMYP